METETPDWSVMTEREWLDAWHVTLELLEDMRDRLVDPESGMDLDAVQVAHLDGELAMLRRVLASRGVDLED